MAGDRRLPRAALRGRAEGQRVEWIHNGEVVAVTPLQAHGRATHSGPAKTGDWFSVILRDTLGPTAFSNAVYVNDEDDRRSNDR
jgi:hypothetical protein